MGNSDFAVGTTVLSNLYTKKGAANRSPVKTTNGHEGPMDGTTSP